MAARGSRRLYLVGAVVALGLAACGGGPSMEEYTQEANAICREHRETIEAEASKLLAGGELPTPQEVGRLAQGTIIPELKAQFEELREVEPADDVTAEYEAYLSEGEQVVTEMEQNPAILQNPANFQDVNDQADAAGLSDACHLGPQ